MAIVVTVSPSIANVNFTITITNVVGARTYFIYGF